MIATMAKIKSQHVHIYCHPTYCHAPHSLISPVSGSIEFWVNSGCLDAGPLRGCHQIVLIHTVFQTVRDAPLSRENRPFLFKMELIILILLYYSYPIFQHPVLSFYSQDTYRPTAFLAHSACNLDNAFVKFANLYCF